MTRRASVASAQKWSRATSRRTNPCSAAGSGGGGSSAVASLVARFTSGLASIGTSAVGDSVGALGSVDMQLASRDDLEDLGLVGITAGHLADLGAVAQHDHAVRVAQDLVHLR